MMNLDRPPLTPKIRQLPHKPGVYLYRDRFNRVIYVGKARDLKKRVSQYFHPARIMSADPKMRALLENVWDIETHVVKSEPESILLEGKLIKEFRPRYNISFRDDKKFLLVKINLNDPYPRFQMSRFRKDDGYRYFGPFAHSGALRTTLNMIRKKFNLRSCDPTLPTDAHFKHCLEHVIKNCSAPCMNKITRAGYMERVHQAINFLEGHTGEMIGQMEKEMHAAAARLDFERAAQLRNQMDDLRRTTKPVKRFVRRFETTIDPGTAVTELQQALDLKEPPNLIECFDISNISTTHKVASMVAFRDGHPDNKSYRRYRIRTVEGQDDFASMREVVRRRYHRVLAENLERPGLVIVDGGKGQLSSAYTELTALGLSDLPLIGLAKQREEIFRPGILEPLALDHNTGALRLLQRIRDEAHRVANGYHQLLMKQRVNESVLDDCPGISENRKKLLLQHFGSMERLRKADVNAVTEIPGIGPKMAETIVNYLARISKKSSSPSENVSGLAKLENGDVIYQLRPQE